MTATYGKTFSKSHEFTETHNITVSPYTRVEVIGVLPMEKVTPPSGR